MRIKMVRMTLIDGSYLSIWFLDRCFYTFECEPLEHPVNLSGRKPRIVVKPPMHDVKKCADDEARGDLKPGSTFMAT